MNITIVEPTHFGKVVFPDHQFPHWKCECNAIIGCVDAELVQSLFGPFIASDRFLLCDIEVTFPHVMEYFRFFKSKSEARRNGWNREIPEGWSQYTIGKLKRKLFILKEHTS